MAQSLASYTGLSRTALPTSRSAKTLRKVTRAAVVEARTTMKKKSVGDLSKADLEGETVFVRCDLNVPLDGDLNITDDTRIRAAIPTLEYLTKNGAKVLVTSHLVRLRARIDGLLRDDRSFTRVVRRTLYDVVSRHERSESDGRKFSARVLRVDGDTERRRRRRFVEWVATGVVVVVPRARARSLSNRGLASSQKKGSVGGRFDDL